MNGDFVKGDLITVFGGSGFVGRHLVQALARRGHRIRVAVRRPDLAGHLQPLGAVGQIMPVQANLRHRWSVDRAVAGADAVVNLVGILAPSGRQSFAAVHDFGARAAAEAARKAGIARFVHMSAIGVDADTDSLYFRTRAAGEAAVRETVPDAVVMRSSLAFGPGDSFFNRFAGMARLSPVLPLIGGGHTLFQPVYVGDIAEAIARAIDGQAQPGTIYELGGPEVESFRGLMELLLKVIDRKRLLVPVPWRIASMQGWFLQKLPGKLKLLTVDQVRQLRVDNIVSPEAVAERRTLAGLGIHPNSMAAILPSYLVPFQPHGQYHQRRAT